MIPFQCMSDSCSDAFAQSRTRPEGELADTYVHINSTVFSRGRYCPREDSLPYTNCTAPLQVPHLPWAHRNQIGQSMRMRTAGNQEDFHLYSSLYCLRAFRRTLWMEAASLAPKRIALVPLSMTTRVASIPTSTPLTVTPLRPTVQYLHQQATAQIQPPLHF